ELPWRLILSPNHYGAFAHSLVPVEHNGRVELWHSRLGVRGDHPDIDGHPTVDEDADFYRTVRAVWARDFDVLSGNPDWAFHSPPVSANFPKADGTDDRPQVRMALASRDRMMLVHETSNFHLTKTAGRRKSAWTPSAVPADRLMVSALGGWLHSQLSVPTLPDGGLTIEEWKHRAA